MKYIFANWKENTNYEEAKSLVLWVSQCVSAKQITDKEVVIFPPAVFLIPLSQEFAGVRLLFGVQDVSKFKGGPYTGEISVSMVGPYATYCLIGHSERRRHFGETPEVVNEKIKNCLEGGLIPIVCVSSEEQLKAIELQNALGPIFLAYEPVGYIGGEENQDVGELLRFMDLVRGLSFKGNVKFIYGGSVNGGNASKLLNLPGVAGLLIGHNSLKQEEFVSIVTS